MLQPALLQKARPGVRNVLFSVSHARLNRCSMLGASMPVCERLDLLSVSSLMCVCVY
jgi:hypothetical protein